jgi:phage tail sheath protein FI
MRDILYENKINPIAFIPNRGLTVFGQKTNAAVASALDRINVSRLVAKMKYDLARLLEPFLFELNDAVTRRSAQVVTERYLSGLKSLRALFDYAVRCDESNNPASTIDANQLFVDVAIKPAKAIEFIFVPIQILGTGDSFAF